MERYIKNVVFAPKKEEFNRIIYRFDAKWSVIEKMIVLFQYKK